VAVLLSVSFSVGAGGDAPDKDVETVKRRIYEDLLPGQPDPGSAEVQEIHKKAHGHATGLGKNGRWKDVEYRDKTPSSWKAVHHLYRLRDMAISCRLPGHDPNLEDNVLKALDHWLVKDYRNPNWWWNCIGVPRQLGDVLILMEKKLSPEQLKKGIEILRKGYRDGKWDYHGDATGQNLVWLCSIHVVRGCLENDPDEVARPMTRIAQEIRVTSAEGVQADMSFHQHGPCLYSGGYGLGFSVDCARFAYYASGTRFAFPEKQIDILTSYILDGQQWMMRAGTFDYGAVGREIVRPGIHYRGHTLAKAGEYMARVPGKRKAEFESLAKRLRAGTDEGAPVGSRYFCRSALLVHRRKEYYASVRMLRHGLHATDGAHNGEGPLSHRLSDGVTYILRSGREYEDIFPVWDWRRVPGITAVQSSTPCEVRTVSAQGIRTFVGAASDGTYGAAAMDFSTPARGKEFPAGQLKARKAWFFFDREFACLGAGIESASADPVITSVNQCLLREDVHSSGKADRKDGHTALKTPGWLHHDGVGYLFFEGTDACISTKTQSGSWKRIRSAVSAEEVSLPVFSVWLDHGVKPSGASYRYVVAPSLAEEDMEAYSWNHGIEFLSNTTELQAVRHRRLQILMAAFYRAGALTQPRGPSIKVDQPCIIIMHTKEGERRISAARPDFGRKPLNVAVGDEKIALELPGGAEAGASVTKELK